MKNKKHKQSTKQGITQSKVFKAAISLVSGATAVVVLLLTISSVMRPYYEMQRDIDKILAHMETQTTNQENNTKEIKSAEEDITVLVRALHTILRIESGETIEQEELDLLLKYFEDHVIYNDVTAGTTAQNAADDATASIAEITNSTIDALKNLQ